MRQRRVGNAPCRKRRAQPPPVVCCRPSFCSCPCLAQLHAQAAPRTKGCSLSARQKGRSACRHACAALACSARCPCAPQREGPAQPPLQHARSKGVCLCLCSLLLCRSSSPGSQSCSLPAGCYAGRDCLQCSCLSSCCCCSLGSPCLKHVPEKTRLPPRCHLLGSCRAAFQAARPASKCRCQHPPCIAASQRLTGSCVCCRLLCRCSPPGCKAAL